jgi:transposase
MWFVGIDWGDRAHEIAAVDEHGGSGGTLHIAHTADGLQELIHWLLALSARPAAGEEGKQRVHPERIACIVETNAGLLVTALLDAGFPVYPVNPKTLGRRRNPAGAKTDQIDALLLARLGRSDLAELRRLTPQSPLVEELRGLTRDQDHLIGLQTHLLNQLTACLKAAYPAGLTLFSKLQQRATLLFLLRYPSLAEAQAASVDELVAFLRTMPYFPGALVVAQRIYTRLHAAQPLVSSVTARVKARLIQALVSQLLPLLEQIAAYDAEITRLFTSHADAAVFASLPGAGKRLAPRLLAGWGDDKARFTSAADMQGLAGTAPVTWQSGQYRVAHRRMACNKPLRQTLHQFAWHSTEKDAWAKDYYLRKRKEGKSHSVAVRALANQWVRVIHAMWRASTPYDPLILQVARAAHGRAAA